MTLTIPGPRAMIGMTGRPDLPLGRRPEWSPKWLANSLRKLADIGYRAVDIRCLAGEKTGPQYPGSKDIPSAGPFAMDQRERKAMERELLAVHRDLPSDFVANAYLSCKLPRSLSHADLDMTGAVLFDHTLFDHRFWWLQEINWWFEHFIGIGVVLDAASTGGAEHTSACERLSDHLFGCGADRVEWEAHPICEVLPTGLWRPLPCPRPTQAGLEFHRTFDPHGMWTPPLTWDRERRCEMYVNLDRVDATDEEIVSLAGRGFAPINTCWTDDRLNTLTLQMHAEVLRARG